MCARPIRRKQSDLREDNLDPVPQSGKFRAEVDLQLALLDHCLKVWPARNEPRPQRTLLRREVPVGAVVPDLVCIDEGFLARPNVARWSWGHAHVVARLRTAKSLRAATIAEKIFTAESGVLSVLADLQAAGIAVSTPTGSFALSDEFRACKPVVTAFEAKLTRWTEALRQAEDYRRFADQVVVVLDLPRNRLSADALAQFRTGGIGLWTWEDGALCEALPARTVRCRGATWEWVVGATFLRSSHTRWFVR